MSGPWVVAVRAAMPSPRPQAWQALQMAAGLADTGRSVTLIADAGRPDGGPPDPAGWLARWPDTLDAALPAKPHRPPLAGFLFRRSLRAHASAASVLLCRDPRVVGAAAGRFAAVVHEWHVRPDPRNPRHVGARGADWHVTVASGLRADLLAFGVPEDRILLLPNACGLDPQRAAARAGLQGRFVVALGLHRRGGLDLALDAWAQAPDLPPLRLAGRDQGGQRTAAWRARIAQDPRLAGRVELAGPAWGPAREDLLDGALAWLALYPDDAETRTRLCPLQVADGLGSGLPLVTTDLPSVEALGGGSFRARAGDPGDLARAVRAALAAERRYSPRPSWQDRAALLASTVESSL